MRLTRLQLESAITAILLVLGHAQAQGILYEIRGSPSRPFRAAVSGGDMTGDKVPDFVVASGTSILVFSGKDGKLVKTLATLGATVTALAGGRDVDGDRVPDVLVGMLSKGWVELRSGKNGFLMRRWTSSRLADRFGESLAFLDDLDSDGRPDVLVTASGTWDGRSLNANPAGFVVAYSSFTGNQLGRFSPGASTRMTDVIPAGDLDCDGRQDVVIAGSYRYERWTRFTKISYSYGIVHAWTPASSAKRTVRQGDSNLGFGAVHNVAVTPDVDKDRCPDLLVSDPQKSRIELVSGKRGQLLRTTSVTGVAALASIGNIDGDAIHEFAVVIPSRKSIRIFAGLDGAELLSHPASGGSIFNAGDLDGDRVPELAEFVSNLVRVYTYRIGSWKAGFATLFEPTGKPTFKPSSLQGTGTPALGQNLSIAIDASGYDVAVVLFGLAVQPGHVAPIPGNPLLLYLDERFTLPFTQPLALVGGRGLFSLPIPQINTLYGLNLGLQAAVLAIGKSTSFGATNLLLANLGFSGPRGASLYRTNVSMSVPSSSNYRDPLGRAARLLHNVGSELFLSLFGTKTSGGPIELRTSTGKAAGKLLGTLPLAAGPFEVRIKLPARASVYFWNADSKQRVTMSAVSLRVE